MRQRKRNIAIYLDEDLERAPIKVDHIRKRRSSLHIRRV